MDLEPTTLKRIPRFLENLYVPVLKKFQNGLMSNK